MLEIKLKFIQFGCRLKHFFYNIVLQECFQFENILAMFVTPISN